MIKDYTRATRECALDNLRPELRTAILEHAQAEQLGDLSAYELFCIETKSERLAARRGFGFLGARRASLAHYSAALLAPPWFLWAVTSADGGTAAFSAHLDSMQVREHNDLVAPGDDGSTILPARPASGEHTPVFLGMEPGYIATSFKRRLREELEKIRRR